MIKKEKTIRTNWIKVKVDKVTALPVCRTRRKNETMTHVSECSQLAQNGYKIGKQE